ncbi:hypothetical protein FA95DRAFT_1608022 [Auriscalpium vulgare]|uniref:Uncharacterized protein n=1 Tax=Auriscalpium vulgare TaxID=40419 RepID=A0ACB8RMC1_9AGAM|nr:hypothetical protein FA95DRAFT_1608022 [Auriscalpium vulgare]
MRTFISTAFFALLLSLAGVAAAAESVDGHTPNPEKCPGAKVLSTYQVPAQGAEGNITIAHFDCDQSAASPAARSFSRVSAARGTLIQGLEKRDQAECTDEAECKCGESCIATCTKTTTTAPAAANCNTIATSFLILGTNNAIGQTFFVSSGNSVLAFFSDCEYEWDNLSSTEIEFCWDDFANIDNSIVSSCLAAKDTGGVCKSVKNDWQLSFAFA